MDKDKTAIRAKSTKAREETLSFFAFLPSPFPPICPNLRESASQTLGLCEKHGCCLLGAGALHAGAATPHSRGLPPRRAGWERQARKFSLLVWEAVGPSGDLVPSDPNPKEMIARESDIMVGYHCPFSKLVMYRCGFWARSVRSLQGNCAGERWHFGH